MDPSLTLTLAAGQIISVTLSTPAEAIVLGIVAAERARLLVDAEIKARTYHLGKNPTPGRGYDDRLTMRMGFGLTKLRELLQLTEERGGLRHQRAGRNYIVTELAVRQWFGDE
jgi:hypothetical protein